jgi:hypothetical protein
MKVVQGDRWILPSASVMSIDSIAGIPASGLLTAFRDLDNDSEFDAEVEPSTPCEIVKGRWSCTVESRQVTSLHVSFAGSEAQYFIPRWDESMRYCVGGVDGCDVPFQPLPLDVSEVRSGCADWRTLWLETSPLSRFTLPPVEVPRLAPSWRQVDSGIELELAGVLPSRVHVWLGAIEAPTWDSEIERAQWTQTADGWFTLISQDALNDCPDCSIGVAVAEHVRSRDSTTGALVLDVRERRLSIATGRR